MDITKDTRTHTTSVLARRHSRSEPVRCCVLLAHRLESHLMASHWRVHGYAGKVPQRRIVLLIARNRKRTAGKSPGARGTGRE